MTCLIEGFENYSITDDGRVFNNKTNRCLKLHPDTKGYIRCSLYKEGKKHTKKVHRLVAQAFIINNENKPEVNHIDGDKTNNVVDNLEWNTTKENCNHARKKLNHTNSKGKDNPLSKKICSLKNGVVYRVYDSINQAKQYGFNIGNICRCLKEKHRKCNGFQWRYLDETIGIQK